MKCDVVPLRKREEPRPAPRDPEPLPLAAQTWTEAADLWRAAERLAIDRFAKAGLGRAPTEVEIAALVGEASRLRARPADTWLRAQERWADFDRHTH